MLNLSISHIPGTVDACPMDGMMHLRFRVQKGMILSAKLVYNCDKNMWHQFRKEADMVLAFSDSELEYYSVAVPLTDTRFSYIFELTCTDGKIRYLSEEGLTGSYDHTLGYFSFFQYTSQFACDTMAVPEWVKTATCYQIFPERFAVGNSEKDTSYVNTKWGVKPTPKSYYGGDLFGIREHLDYLVDLGVNVLYMTPVFCSPTNHKYEITDYENVDPAFGGNEALKAVLNLVGDVPPVGSEVEISGRPVLERGRVIISADKCRVLGSSPLPEPRVADSESLTFAADTDDSARDVNWLRVKVKGRAMGITENGFTIDVDGLPVSVAVDTLPDFLDDCEHTHPKVEVDGVAELVLDQSALFGISRYVLGVRLCAASASDITLLTDMEYLMRKRPKNQ